MTQKTFAMRISNVALMHRADIFLGQKQENGNDNEL